MRKYLKQIVLVICILFAFNMTPAMAENVCKVTATWAAPSYYAKDGNCADQSLPIDPSEVISYTLSWRIKGTTSWNSIETATTSATITGLPFATTLEVMVGAHYAGQSPACFTTISEITTIVKPAPGSCSQLKLTATF